MMARTLKERIIGAAVLVLVAVLVVPVFLDGSPGDGEIVTKHQALPGQADHENKTVVLERDRTEPVPSNGGSESSQQAPEPRPVVVQTESSQEPVVTEPAESKPMPKEPTAEKPTAMASSTGMWAVQLGSFGDQENAERLAADLRKQGFAAFLSQLSTGSGQLHRVRIGPQKDRESAEAMAERLGQAGHKGQVVPHP